MAPATSTSSKCGYDDRNILCSQEMKQLTAAGMVGLALVKAVHPNTGVNGKHRLPPHGKNAFGQRRRVGVVTRSQRITKVKEGLPRFGRRWLPR